MTGLISPENVVQFRAIPYATIPARFARSILKTDLDGTQDFTKHGGGPLPGDIIPPASSESACLILQLAIPLALLQDPDHASKLPVLVYFHGGGFVLGGLSPSLSISLHKLTLSQASTNNTTPRC
ncbi:hypothetical protein SNOG_07767 [Parastagonospora nodorum SN15]|uniref:Carboxylesterase type B domain-containing protein n=1 Tax=Phaeosphaeria nodorum (strain SN15 / ATCC MYA-4574 / FGSC 10173) TaxID=321614 RepID=Q0UKE7_PHANO|nr:hypothetical protein SNOG_07767 [Parastagonospora nodorum SN15]EAT85233.2 hypothetical protein SNOG_07767 [Parastagonospora nodorum SN15]